MKSKNQKKHKTPRDEPVVRCAHTKLEATELLKPNPRNPNDHPPKQLALYAKILLHQGWRRAVVISKRSGLIVTGHGAWLAARQEGWRRIPIDVQKFETPADETAHMLADNGLPQMAEIDTEELKKLLAELGEDMRLLSGFELEELEEMLEQAEFPITAKLNEGYDYVLVFTDNETDFVHLQTLFGVRTESSYKKTGIGIGRCVPFKTCLDALHENHHSLDVQGRDDDHAKARKQLPGRRARKPGRRIPQGDAASPHAS